MIFCLESKYFELTRWANWLKNALVREGSQNNMDLVLGDPLPPPSMVKDHTFAFF